MNRETPPGEASGPQPVIDGSIFASSLSSEFVSQGELNGLLQHADYLLKTNGVRTTLNGIPVMATKAYALTRVGDQQYHVRVCRDMQTDTENNLPKIVFDETSDNTVTSPNPNAIRFTMFADRPGLQIDEGMEPRVNNVADVQAVAGLLKGISDAVETDKQKKLEQLEAERQQRLHEQQQKHDDRIYFLKRAGHVGRQVLVVMAGLTLSAGALGAASFAGYEINNAIQNSKSFNQAFDAHNYRLQGGKVIALGQTVSPAYSVALFADQRLTAAKMPDMSYEDNQGTHQTSTLPANGELREVKIGSDKKNHNCNSFKISPAPLDDHLSAWTDFTSPNGQSRADELTITYQVGQGTACWNGPKLIKNDQPRVVVALEPNQAPTSS